MPRRPGAHGRRIAKLISATGLMLSGMASAQEQQPAPTPTQTAAAERAALASIAEANAKIAQSNAATTAAIVQPLASLAGTGKRDLAGTAGQIETAMLGGTALVSLADRIAGEVGGRKVVILSDDERLNVAAGWQFDAEAEEIRYHFEEARKAGAGVCPAPRAGKPVGDGGGPKLADGGLSLAAGLAAGGPFAVLGAIGALLQSDVTVTGVAYGPKSRVVSSLVAQRLGANAITPDGLLMPDTEAVGGTLAGLRVDQRSAADAARHCSALAADKRSPAQAALLADIAATGSALAALRTRLFTPGSDGRAPVVDVAMARSLPGRDVLRIRVEDAGGSVIATRNVLTVFGAPALSVTGGVVASYSLSDPRTGALRGGALFRCQARARMLRSVHKAGTAAAVCTRL